MFGGIYLDWNKVRIKAILDFYGQKFFYRKSVLELGAGFCDVGATISRLGSDVSAVDVRQDHLKIINKKFPNIQTIRADLDQKWSLGNKKYDLIVDMGLMCHLLDYKKHLQEVCAHTDHLILETYVVNSSDENISFQTKESRAVYDLSYNGGSNIPTASSIEKILRENGFSFKRMDDPSLNVGNYKYDWKVSENNEVSRNNRRMWFAVRDGSPIKFKSPEITVISKKEDNLVLDNYVRMIPVKTNLLDEDIISWKRFVIIIPSYNNENWCKKNILSALDQNYSHFRIIYIDDASKDETFNIINEVSKKHINFNKLTILKNKENKGALENLYHAIHSCDDDEIVLTLDGDDWLPHNDVLNILNKEYSNNDIWMLNSQYQNSNDGQHGCSGAYSPQIVSTNAFRQDVWKASHLRTFYAWLFKSIKKEDLMDGDKFYDMTWDMAMQFPMLEMSGFKSKFLNEILYVYNMENPNSDHNKNRARQAYLDGVIRNKSKYITLNSPNIEQKNVGLLIIATNKYVKFVQQLITSADQFFLSNQKVKYFIFSDQNLEITSNREYELIKIKHKTFPYASMERFKHFYKNKNKLERMDFLYYCDVDSSFVGPIHSNIMGDLVGVRHCGYLDVAGPVETNPNSSFYAPLEKYQYYFGGGFSGGKTDSYLQLSKICADLIDQDLKNEIMPIFHDETAINYYFSSVMQPDVILSPAYHYPQSNLEHYRNIWKGKNFSPKIMLLDKNHEEVRS